MAVHGIYVPFLSWYKKGTKENQGFGFFWDTAPSASSSLLLSLSLDEQRKEQRNCATGDKFTRCLRLLHRFFVLSLLLQRKYLRKEPTEDKFCPNLRSLHKSALKGFALRLCQNFALPLRGTSSPWTANAHSYKWLKKIDLVKGLAWENFREKQVFSCLLPRPCASNTV